MTASPGDVVRAANQALLVEGDLDRIGTYFTEDHVVHLTGRDMGGGHAAIRRVLGMLRRAFPSIEVRVDVLAHDGDRVSWQRTLTGVQEGSYAGFPATRKRIIWRDMATSRVEDGRIAEEWMVSDLAERLLLARKG